MDSMFAAIVGFPITQNRGAQQKFSISINVLNNIVPIKTGMS